MYKTNRLLAYKAKTLKFRNLKAIYKKKLAKIMILNIIANKFCKKLTSNQNQSIMKMKENCRRKNHFYKCQQKIKLREIQEFKK